MFMTKKTIRARRQSWMPAVVAGLLWSAVATEGRLAAPLEQAIRPQEEADRQLPEQQQQNDRLIPVVVTLWEDCFLPDFIDKLDFFEATLQVVLKRSHSLSLQLPVRNLELLSLDTCTQLVEADDDVESLSSSSSIQQPRISRRTASATQESIPWGVHHVVQDFDAIPPPPANADCFKVCVIDSGVMIDHPDIPFARENVQGAEFLLPAGQTWDRPAPHNTHGTHVTGSILSERGNGRGIVGVSPGQNNMCLLFARVFPDSADTNSGSAVTAAVEWCADQGAKVINMSLGGIKPSEYGRRLYQSIHDEGRLIVAAAGNGNSNRLLYPASFPSVMSVAAVGQSRNNKEQVVRGFFSQYNEQVDLAAPGVDILSTIPGATVSDSNRGKVYRLNLLEYATMPSGSTTLQADLVDCGRALGEKCQARGKICLIERGDVSFLQKATACQAGGGVAAIVYNNVDGPFFGTLSPDNDSVTIPVVSVRRSDGLDLLRNSQSVQLDFAVETYGYMSGTSMAAPYVSGAAALIWSARPACSHTQVRQALEATATDLGEKGRDDEFGHGMVNATAAYRYLLQQDPPCGEVTGDMLVDEQPTDDQGTDAVVDGGNAGDEQPADDGADAVDEQPADDGADAVDEQPADDGGDGANEQPADEPGDAVDGIVDDNNNNNNNEDSTGVDKIPDEASDGFFPPKKGGLEFISKDDDNKLHSDNQVRGGLNRRRRQQRRLKRPGRPLEKSKIVYHES